MLTIGMRMERRPRLQSIVSSTPLVHGRCLHSLGADNEAFLVPNKCIETNYLVRRVERPFVTSLPWLLGTPLHDNYVSLAVSITLPHLDSFGRMLCPCILVSGARSCFPLNQEC